MGVNDNDSRAIPSLTVDLGDGRSVSVPIGWYPRLAYGAPAGRNNFRLTGAGYGIHWPDLDEDIGVEGLLLGKKSRESTSSFERWLRSRPLDQANLLAVAPLETLHPAPNVRCVEPAITLRWDRLLAPADSPVEPASSGTCTQGGHPCSATPAAHP